MTELEKLRNTITDLIEDDTLNFPRQKIAGSKIFLTGRISALKEVLRFVEDTINETKES